MKASAYSEP